MFAEQLSQFLSRYARHKEILINYNDPPKLVQAGILFRVGNTRLLQDMLSFVVVKLSVDAILESTIPIRNWSQVLNQIVIRFEERVDF